MTTGTGNTYGFTTGLMLDFEAFIYENDPFDTPMLGGLGADGSSVLASGNCFEKKVEWQEEDSLTPRTTLGVAYTAADGYITIASGERERFQTDDLVLIDTQVLRISGYGTTTNTLTVATWSGADANHVTASVVVGVGSAPIEGADPAAARQRDRNAKYNLTQIVGPYKVSQTGSELAVRKYGVANEFDHQLAARIKESTVAVEQMLAYGQRVDDTTTYRRSAGGIGYYISTNTSSTTALTEAKLLSAMQTCFDAGGNPNRIVGGSQQKKTISAFTSAGTVQVQRADTQRGMIVSTFISDFGLATVVLNRWYRITDLHIFNRDQAEVVTLRGLHYESLAKTGDSDNGMIVGEKSFKFRNEKHAYKYTALA